MSIKDWRGHKPQLISYLVKAQGAMKLFAGDQLDRHFHDRKGLQEAVTKLGFSEYIEISQQDLSGFDFSQMDLKKVRFIGCKLCHADFDGADVSGTRIDGSDLSGALISKSQLQQMKGIPATEPYNRLIAGRLRMMRRNGPGF